MLNLREKAVEGQEPPPFQRPCHPPEGSCPHSCLLLLSLILCIDLFRPMSAPALAAGLQVIVQDKWKDGARNTMESGGRKIGENKLLSKKKRCAAGSSLLRKRHRHAIVRRSAGQQLHVSAPLAASIHSL